MANGHRFKDNVSEANCYQQEHKHSTISLAVDCVQHPCGLAIMTAIGYVLSLSLLISYTKHYTTILNVFNRQIVVPT